jgi:hypothetical protein
MTEPKNHVQLYCEWLQHETVVKEADHKWGLITLPYLDRHNDYLTIYVKKDGNDYILTDDGFIIDDLITVGYSPDDADDRAKIDCILTNYGVSLSADYNELTIQTNAENFVTQTHNLLQTILTLSAFLTK